MWKKKKICKKKVMVDPLKKSVVSRDRERSEKKKNGFRSYWRRRSGKVSQWKNLREG